MEFCFRLYFKSIVNIPSILFIKLKLKYLGKLFSYSIYIVYIIKQIIKSIILYMYLSRYFITLITKRGMITLMPFSCFFCDYFDFRIINVQIMN